MKYLITTIFPLLTYQHIYQLEGYSPIRFLRWWISHPFTRRVSAKKPLVITPRVRSSLIISLSTLIGLLLLSLLFPPLLPLFIFSTLFPFPLIFFATLIRLIPDELIDRPRKIKATRRCLDSLPSLTTIGITGSFGKTSTKDFLYEILSRHANTVKTPQSYNTVLSLAKVVDFEVFEKTRYFLAELAAYKRGEIKELAQEVNPTYAILTAIGTQHLERFKYLKNTTIAKFELIDAVDPSKAIVNLDNAYIKNHLSLPRYKNVNTYSFTDPSATFFVSSHQLSSNGVTFKLKYQNKVYDFSSPLFGTSNLQNLVAAISMALLLKVPYLTIKSALNNLKPSPHRLELKKIGESTLIDNAYSSNKEGLTQLLADLTKLKGTKAIITPGIVELGIQTIPVHQELGTLAAPIFKEVYLEGHSDRTHAFETGLREGLSKAKITYLTSPEDLWPTINKLTQKYDWILLENDLPDNY